MPDTVPYGFIAVALTVLLLLLLVENRSWQRLWEAGKRPVGRIGRVVLVGARCVVVSGVAMLLYVTFAGLNAQRDVRAVLGNMFVVTLVALLAIIILAEFLPGRDGRVTPPRDRTP